MYRHEINVCDLSSFQRFVRMCAARTGQLLNLSSLASDCGITHNTASAWISVLEASYIIFLFRPHFSNFNKRLIKAPKRHSLQWTKKELISIFNSRKNLSSEAAQYSEKSLSSKRFERIFADIVELLLKDKAKLDMEVVT